MNEPEGEFIREIPADEADPERTPALNVRLYRVQLNGESFLQAVQGDDSFMFRSPHARRFAFALLEEADR